MMSEKNKASNNFLKLVVIITLIIIAYIILTSGWFDRFMCNGVYFAGECLQYSFP